MCIGKPECQNCETCGRRKYQLWASSDMHERGCPFGFNRLDQCTETVNRGKLLRWSLDNGVNILERGVALVEQLEACGVDLRTPPEEWEPLP